MPRRTDTRDRTLRTAVDLFRARGYHGTGMNQVISEGKLPKGSLYFHFPEGKEQLAAEAVELAAAEVCGWVDVAFSQTPNPATALSVITETLAAGLVDSDYRLGCPIGTVAHDAGDSERVREACAAAFSSWHATISGHLARHGLSEPDSLATAVLAALEGAQLVARSQRDVAPLHTVATMLAPLLKGA
ncbi:TetR/AcrR family transcriptional repressor of lmrAB and yxaGH operons [Actinokineospora baliensis]|uniref:TetR/AcrR family transcriptional regulator n=1 Tax=Actinokineospora baliensis TaxID=547056 RepID=UPI00195F01B8|nr:TetR/AcrR family transcriptional regulator [Actinokineospora baliensis]MBM7771632.1 TetR/AcrR family transcriptional repressor of lmrAB and yxaGH operons [Actinokineospora baliensis]